MKPQTCSFRTALLVLLSAELTSVCSAQQPEEGFTSRPVIDHRLEIGAFITTSFMGSFHTEELTGYVSERVGPFWQVGLNYQVSDRWSLGLTYGVSNRHHGGGSDDTLIDVVYTGGFVSDHVYLVDLVMLETRATALTLLARLSVTPDKIAERKGVAAQFGAGYRPYQIRSYADMLPDHRMQHRAGGGFYGSPKERPDGEEAMLYWGYQKGAGVKNVYGLGLVFEYRLLAFISQRVSFTGEMSTMIALVKPRSEAYDVPSLQGTVPSYTARLSTFQIAFGLSLYL